MKYATSYVMYGTTHVNCSILSYSYEQMIRMYEEDLLIFLSYLPPPSFLSSTRELNRWKYEMRQKCAAKIKKFVCNRETEDDIFLIFYTIILATQYECNVAITHYVIATHTAKSQENVMWFLPVFRWTHFTMSHSYSILSRVSVDWCECLCVHHSLLLIRTGVHDFHYDVIWYLSKSPTHIEMCHQFRSDENERNPQTLQSNGVDGNGSSDISAAGVLYHL